MYNYKLKEEDSKASKYQQKRIEAFDELESRLDNIKKLFGPTDVLKDKRFLTVSVIMILYLLYM
mgnify:CR=1 FL=1